MRGKPGPKFGQTCLRDPALRKARALLIIEKRITKNMSNGEIAKVLNVHPETIAREIDWAKRQGIVQNFEEQVLRDLVPAALKTVLELIAADSTGPMVRADLAKEVLKGVGLLRKPSTHSTYAAPPEAEPEADTLEMYIRKRTVRGGTEQSGISHPPEPLALPSGDAQVVYEGCVLTDAAGSAESTPSPVGDDRDEDRTAHTE